MVYTQLYFIYEDLLTIEEGRAVCERGVGYEVAHPYLTIHDHFYRAQEIANKLTNV